MNKHVKDEKDIGLYEKFIVHRTDGSSEPGGKHENCEYFVLDLNHDKFAKAALRAYAEACADEFPYLSRDLLLASGKCIKSQKDSDKINLFPSMLPMSVNPHYETFVVFIQNTTPEVTEWWLNQKIGTELDVPNYGKCYLVKAIPYGINNGYCKRIDIELVKHSTIGYDKIIEQAKPLDKSYKRCGSFGGDLCESSRLKDFG